ncbi:ribonuclease H-like protein [Calocera cornea HHB12733]|uniref:RNA exonuclease 4 n=1 Tax=Calocera cornea HHB12733 TaxID=1353952 RepID=A0A165IYG3_9BASI|nr:ribonuclease H-like protein [Calocera cornea HHB12733]
MASVSGEKPARAALPPSSNWAALKKSIGVNGAPKGIKRKRDTMEASSSSAPSGSRPSASAKLAENEPESFPRGNSYAQIAKSAPKIPEHTITEPETKRSKTTVSEMRSLVLGTLSKSQTPEQGKYIALDCEMVGVGPNGEQSSLARVSVVNYHGAVLLDKFVRQVERVTDYRTRWSGIRPKDLEGAEGFKEVQAEVAKLMEGRVVVGHALSNDMHAMLLSHPHQYTRDTQTYTELRKLAKTKKPGLRKLIQLELGLDIQAGEHDSVTDARASMALFRLHKDAWDRSLPASHHLLGKDQKGKHAGKGKDAEGADGAGGRKGVSSGLSVVTHVREKDGAVSRRVSGKIQRRMEEDRGGRPGKSEVGAWWETLEDEGQKRVVRGRKASLRVAA